MELRGAALHALPAAAMLLAAAVAGGAERFIVVASTTSTEQSGLFRSILPRFEKRIGIRVRVVAVGTGQALDLGRRGDADVVLAHAPEAEERFVAEGYGVGRVAVMYNDFVLVGPSRDPARARGADILEALRRIRTARVPFVSRGDRSGTHLAELALWAAAGIELARERGPWYRETGQGMGPALNTASSMNAYVLSDRGTWISFRNRGELAVLVAGDPRLRNRYSAILVNPARHPHLKTEWGEAFIAWLVSPEGQNAIAEHRIAGEPLFFPAAERSNR